jgi:hypothetical protein
VLSPWVLARAVPTVHPFRILPEAGVAEEVAQDRAFRRPRCSRTTLARSWQIDAAPAQPAQIAMVVLRHSETPLCRTFLCGAAGLTVSILNF